MGFTLVFAVIPVGPEREALLGVLRAWSGVGDVPPLHFAELGPGENPLALLSDLGLGGGPRAGVVLDGLEGAMVKEGGRFADSVFSLNLGRDLLRTLVPGPLVIPASEEVMRNLAIHFPDFYSWRCFAGSPRAPR